MRTWTICLLLLQLSSASILLDYVFDDGFGPFQTDLSGPLCEAYIGPSLLNDTQNMFYSNVTYEEGSDNYRAEIAISPVYREQFQPANTGDMWWSFRMLIPEDYEFEGARDKSEVSYFAQLHGGDNYEKSPIWAVRFLGDQLEFLINGAAYDENRTMEEESTVYLYLGLAQIGEMMDFVVHVNMDYEDSSGSVEVWRSGQLMVNETGLFTSFNDTNPHYLKLGCFNLNWKNGQATNNHWMSQLYSHVRIADGNTTFEEMYVGEGDFCGSYCTPPDEPAGKKKHTYVPPITKNIFFLAFVPLGVIVVLTLFFFIAKKSMEIILSDENRVNRMRERKTLVQRKRNRLSAAEQMRDSNTDNRLSTLRPSLRNSLVSAVYAFRNTVVWAEEEEYIHSSQLWENPWKSSLRRKVFWYCFGYSFVFGMFAIAMVLYGNPLYPSQDGLLPWKIISQWQPQDAVAFMVITFVMTSAFFIPLLFIPIDLAEGKKWKNDPDFLNRIGVVIPCHKSADEIATMLKQILKYIPPGNVVICDNGNFDWPKDNTFEVVKAVHPDLVYTFTSQGHKTRALWTGLHRLPPHVEYILHVDDDTLLSDEFVFDESHFTTHNAENVVAVAFMRKSHRMNRCTEFIDFWYKITDHFHATQAFISTRCFVPGPAGIWKRKIFEEIFAHHPALPFGEDIFGGFTILNHGYAIRSERRCFVTTFSPPQLLNLGFGVGREQGYGAASIWKQRAHRWTVSALRITGKSLYSFFTYKAIGGIGANIAFRLYRFREYKIILVQILYIPFCVVILARGLYKEFFVLKFGLFAFPLLRNLYINYVVWRNNPEVQVKFETVLLSPFYNYFLIMCAVHGRLKCLLWYIPEVPPNHGMLQATKPHPIESIRVMRPPKQVDQIDARQSVIMPIDEGDESEDEELGAAGPNNEAALAVLNERRSSTDQRSETDDIESGPAITEVENEGDIESGAAITEVENEGNIGPTVEADELLDSAQEGVVEMLDVLEPVDDFNFELETGEHIKYASKNPFFSADNRVARSSLIITKDAHKKSVSGKFVRADYFEYFFRDGRSIFISYKAGGLNLSNPGPGEVQPPDDLEKRNSITGLLPDTDSDDEFETGLPIYKSSVSYNKVSSHQRDGAGTNGEIELFDIYQNEDAI